MSRPNEPLAGYALLEEKQRIEEADGLEPTPFIIYTGSTTPKYRQKALEKGAFGQTSRPEKLFHMIKEAILQRSPP